jgi:Family of unknown function (DUF6455)
MNAGYISAKVSGFRHLLVDLITEARRWAAVAKARRNSRDEIESLDRIGELDGILSECSLSRSDIETLVSADPQASRRLEQMLERLDLTDRLRKSERGWSRDIQTVCFRCQAIGQCDHWLKGDKEGGIEQFCPNAETFKALHGAQVS